MEIDNQTLLLKCDQLESENKRLKSLLKETRKAVEIAVGAELDHGDYASADRFRLLKGVLASVLEQQEKNH